MDRITGEVKIYKIKCPQCGAEKTITEETLRRFGILFYEEGVGSIVITKLVCNNCGRAFTKEELEELIRNEQ